MPRICTICSHEKRQEIDSALVSGIATLRTISDWFSVSIASLKRHKENGHVVRKITKAGEIRERLDADKLLDILDDLLGEARTTIADAKKSGDHRVRLAAVREARETAAKMLEFTVIADMEKRLEQLEKTPR
jgi:hypothetical protein